jgi:hypothetical protein
MKIANYSSKYWYDTNGWEMTHPWVQATLRYQKWLFQRISSAPPQLQTLWKLNLILTSVACAVGPSVNPLQNTKMWTLFCNVRINFLNSPIWKEIMLDLNGKLSSVTTFSADFSFQNLVFLEFIWIFSCRNHLKINISHILNPNFTK